MSAQIAEIIITLIHMIAKWAIQANMTEEQINQEFHKQWILLKQNDPNKLPDA